MLKIIAIAAVDEEMAIGKEGSLAWHSQEDMRYFSEKTRGHTVLMGSKTYHSLPAKFRPLPQRKNIVITSQPEKIANNSVEIWSDPNQCIAYYKQHPLALPSNILWIIGGEKIYKASLRFCDELYLTRISGKHQGDTFFPSFEKHFSLVFKSGDVECVFEVYKRI
jgi:dihydrofolate reductase